MNGAIRLEKPAGVPRFRSVIRVPLPTGSHGRVDVGEPDLDAAIANRIAVDHAVFQAPPGAKFEGAGAAGRLWAEDHQIRAGRAVRAPYDAARPGDRLVRVAEPPT
jgi:hypothetical protein